MKKLLIAAAASSACFILPAVHAATGASAPTLKVRFVYADLLNDAADAALYGQLQRAARTVCRRSEHHEPGLPSAKAREFALDCIQSTFLKSVAAVNHPTFSAYVAARFPAAPSATGTLLVHAEK
jgi:UrcA family protein